MPAGWPHLVLDVHLVKLVDAADAVVGKHQRARLNGKLSVLGLLGEAHTSNRQQSSTQEFFS